MAGGHLDAGLDLAVDLHGDLNRLLDALGLIVGRPGVVGSCSVWPSCCHSSSVMWGANGFSSCSSSSYSALVAPP